MEATDSENLAANDTSSSSQVSFKFSKKIVSKNLSTSLLSNEKHETRSNDIKDARVKRESVKFRRDDGELVIPLLKTNRWNHKTPLDELSEQALIEVVEESLTKNEAREKHSYGDDVAIPLLLRNAVPAGFETEERLNVTLRPDQATEADYEQIPIEAFGKAMLRGMGWKPGKGIGGKDPIAPVEAVLRPKGLGLGAGKSNKQNPKGDSEDEEESLSKGSCIVVDRGSHKGFYGKVEGLDEDNARAFVKLTVSGKTITISQSHVRAVTHKEYKKYSKYINKAETEIITDRTELDHYNGDDEVHERLKDGRKAETTSVEKTRKRKHNQLNSQDGITSETPSKIEKYWLQPLLRVRLIDKNYKNGKYYKEKVIIEDVVNLDTCVCRTDDRRLLEDVKQSMLETVIPRNDPAYVMILEGEHKRKLAIILKRDKSRNVATVQFLLEQDIVQKFPYDSVCEYTGDVNSYALL